MTFILLLCALTTRADNDIKEKILEIKLDPTYVTGEGSDADEQVAYDMAMGELSEIVNDQRKREGKYPIDANDIDTLTERICYEETGKHEVFVYMKMDKALGIVKELSPEDTTTVTRDAPTDKPTRSYTSVNAMLLQAGDGNEAFRFLKQFKEEGAIDDYGKAKAPGDIPADAYKLLVSGADLSIIAILSPQNINIRTNKTDDINNYSNKAVVWYK